MPLVMSLVALSICLALVSGLVNVMSGLGRSSYQVEQQAEKFDLARDLGPIVRRAYDIGQTLASCPAGTQRLTDLDNRVQLCWPRGANRLCIQPQGEQNQNYWICPVTGGDQSMSDIMQNLFLPSAIAGETVRPIRAAQNASVGGGVRVRLPSCTGVPESTPCVDCGRADTECFTMRFCLSSQPQPGCPNQEMQVDQTFVIRQY